MRRIRVLQLAWRLSRGGGAQAVQRSILKRTDRERFDVHVSTVRPLLPEDSLEELGSDLTYHPLNLLGRVSWRDHGRIAAHLARVVRSVRPDILHVHGSDGFYTILPFFPREDVRATIFELHDAPEIWRFERLKTLLGRWMVHRLGYRPLVHANSVRESVSRAYKLPVHRASVIPLGVDVAFFAQPQISRSDWRRRHAIPEDAAVVVYVSRLVAVKNLGLYIDVARRVTEKVDNSVFVAVGGGSLGTDLQTRVQRHGLQDRVRFLGARYGRDLVDAYHAADVFLSTSNFESFGLAIVEAMASGRPVVSTCVGGTPELVVEGVTGRLCPAGDVGSLVLATVELLQDAALRKQWGEAAQERARQLFDVGRMVEAYQDLYEALVHDQATQNISGSFGRSPMVRQR